MWWPALGLSIGLMMAAGWETPAGAVLAALVTAGLAWWINRRRQSGSIRTSEAGELWTAYDRIQERTERALERTEGKLAAAEGRIAGLETEVVRLKARLRAAGIDDE